MCQSHWSNGRRGEGFGCHFWSHAGLPRCHSWWKRWLQSPHLTGRALGPLCGDNLTLWTVDYLTIHQNLVSPCSVRGTILGTEDSFMKQEGKRLCTQDAWWCTHTHKRGWYQRVIVKYGGETENGWVVWEASERHHTVAGTWIRKSHIKCRRTFQAEGTARAGTLWFFSESVVWRRSRRKASVGASWWRRVGSSWGWQQLGPTLPPHARPRRLTRCLLFPCRRLRRGGGGAVLRLQEIWWVPTLPLRAPSGIQ